MKDNLNASSEELDEFASSGLCHLVRGSEISGKRRCLRLWDIGWRQNWQPNIPAQALEFGTSIHAGMQAIYEPSTWDQSTPGQKLANALKAFEECCSVQCEQYLVKTGQANRRLTWDGRDDYDNRIDLGRHMLEYYVLNVHPREDEGLRPVKVEIPFQVPIFGSEGKQLQCWNSPTCGQNHKPGALVYQVGRIDAIMEDLVRGGYLVVDWKSVGGDKAIDGNEKQTSRFSRPDLVWTHSQLGPYCSALRYGLNLDIRGFILAEIRKDYPRVPIALKRRNKGGMFSQSHDQSTEFSIYNAHVRANDPNGWASGAYNEYLDWLQSDEAPVFHQRIRVETPTAMLKEIGRNLAAEVEDMLRPDLKIFPEQGPFTCPRCAYRGPCDMMMMGLDYRYTLNSGFYQESRYDKLWCPIPVRNRSHQGSRYDGQR